MARQTKKASPLGKALGILAHKKGEPLDRDLQDGASATIANQLKKASPMGKLSSVCETDEEKAGVALTLLCS